VDSTDYGNLTKKQINILKAQKKKHKPAKNYHLVHNEDVFAPLPDKLELEFVRTTPFGHREFAFKPTQQFTNLTETYKFVKDSGDPNNLAQFVQTHPFYPEALYDFGDFMRLQNNNKDANHLLEQALYFYEECFVYDFNIYSNDLKNLVVLDYEYNTFTKIFFKCVLIMIEILQKKGCYKSALEYNKFLLKLNPIQDPCSTLLKISYTAISAKQYDWFVNFAFKFGKQYHTKQNELESKANSNSILMYPNILFSVA